MIPCVDEIKYAVNMRSLNISFNSLCAFTKDKVEILCDGYVSVKVFNPERAVFNVQNCLAAVRTFAQSSVRTSVGKLELQEILDNRGIINEKVIADLKDEIE